MPKHEQVKTKEDFESCYNRLISIYKDSEGWKSEKFEDDEGLKRDIDTLISFLKTEAGSSFHKEHFENIIILAGIFLDYNYFGKEILEKVRELIGVLVASQSNHPDKFYVSIQGEGEA